MHNINSKKGFSNAITMVVLIVVAIASIFLIYGIIINLITKQLSPDSFNCVEFQLYPPYDISSACLNDKNEIEVTLASSLTDNNLNYFEFLVSANSFTRYGCGNLGNQYQCSGCLAPSPGETKTFFLNANTLQNPQEISILIGECILNSPVQIVNC